jgi:hypothetical protein
MTSLLERLGVDAYQWRALTKASMRIDFSGFVGKTKAESARQGANLAALFLLVYGAAGITPGIVAAQSRDPLLAGTALVVTVSFMVMFTLMMGEGMSVVSPNDHAVIGFRPVTSRTYMAVRIAALLVRAAAVALIVPLITIVVLVVKGRPEVAVAAFVAGQLSAVATTLGVVAMYGWVLRVAGPERTMRYVGYMQLVANFVAWGGFLLVTQDINKRVIGGLSLSNTSWWIALPPAWFGSYLPIAAGSGGWLTAVAAALSIASIVGLGWLIRDKLSMAYTEQLSRLAAVTTSAAPRRSAWLGALNDETRAIAILVRSQMEHDMKFRLALISMIPVTLIYMFAGGWPSDPFIRGSRGSGNPGMIQMALLFIPMSLRQTIVSSESYRASWIYHVTPADRSKLVLSARNVITGFFLIPYLACLAALFAWAFGNSSHALLHAAFMGLLSWAVLQFTIMLNPQLPFSLPHGKDADVAMALVRMIASIAIGLAGYWALVYFVYGHTLRMLLAAAVFILIGFAMDSLTRIRVRRRTVEAMTAD